MSWRVLVCSALALCFCSQPSFAEVITEHGTLSEDDSVLSDGCYYDSFSLELEAGDVVVLSMESSEFDAFVQMQLDALPPQFEIEGEAAVEYSWFNDDGPNGRNALLEVVIPVAGNYSIWATSYNGGVVGNYVLTIETTSSSTNDVVVPTEMEQSESGSLEAGDLQTEFGQYFDVFELDLQAGDFVVIDLLSDDFDTFLSVHCVQDPSVQLENDDFEGDLNHSQIAFEAPVTATYSIEVSSYAVESTGGYELVIHSQSGGGPTPPPSSGPVVIQETGTLAEGDVQMYAGEFVDTFTFQGRQGERANITLTSQDFDTYLILTLPDGQQLYNDDFDGSTQVSSIVDLELLQSATYEVQVTSYAVGEVGDYELVIELSSQSNRPGGMLASGDRIQGNLMAQTVTIDDMPADVYQFEATAGTRVLCNMTSPGFDTLIRLVHPNGTMQDFDDNDTTTDSTMDVVLAESGVYTLYATAFAGAGSYHLSFDVVEDRPAGQRILALFVGIGDYPGTDSDLPLSDTDAERLYHVMQTQFGMNPDDAVLLTNADATVNNVMGALNNLGGRARPEDLLLFFYSGHGGQQGGPGDSVDPDGIHEIISVYDGEILDDEFSATFNASPAGTALVVLDSCCSGGFAKDAVSAPGRMGIFSSEEDVLSLVPIEQFQAGGYLSQFFADGVSADRAVSDANGDNQLTAHELSHYLGERYRNEVRSDYQKSGDPIDPTLNLSYQRLVIDRGGIGSGAVIFTWK